LTDIAAVTPSRDPRKTARDAIEALGVCTARQQGLVKVNRAMWIELGNARSAAGEGG
jgi:hypothetical protein